jgi:hypothetical protein
MKAEGWHESLDPSVAMSSMLVVLIAAAYLCALFAVVARIDRRAAEDILNLSKTQAVRGERRGAGSRRAHGLRTIGPHRRGSGNPAARESGGCQSMGIARMERMSFASHATLQ